MNWPITPDDVEELKRVLRDIGSDAELQRAESEAGGFGLFVRALVGLDRAAAQKALGRFLDDTRFNTRFNARQIDYTSLVVQELTENGVVAPKRFYDSPFTDLSPTGPDALFSAEEITELVGALDTIRSSAAA